MTSKTLKVADGKAATIVSSSQLAVNVGSKSGVLVGDIVTVRREVKVTDPDSQAALGTVYLNRLRLQVNMVSDSFSVATVIDPAPSNALAGILDVTRISRMKSIVSSQGDASDSAVYVRPGEPVLVTRIIDEDGNDDDDDQA